MKFTIETLGYIKYFETVTGASAKDCFIDKNNQLVFIVKQGQASKAIGKQGANIRKLGAKFKKRIKVIEFTEDIKKFVSNCIYPLKATEITQEDNKIAIKSNSAQQKALLLGRDKKNLKALQDLVNKFFKVEIIIE